MMNLHPETLYIPYLETDEHGQRVGYVIDSNPAEVRKRFAESMGTGMTWARLKKQGWRIVTCEVIGDEREINPSQFDS